MGGLNYVPAIKLLQHAGICLYELEGHRADCRFTTSTAVGRNVAYALITRNPATKNTFNEVRMSSCWFEIEI